MSSSATVESRLKSIRNGITLEWFTLAWMSVEALLAIGSGVIAHSLSLAAFGFDSVIELLSGAVLMWRLQAELKQGPHFQSRVEHVSHKIAGALLVTLGACIVVAAFVSILRHRGQDFSILGSMVTLAGIVIMFPLARAKRRLAETISSPALKADAAESLACGYLAVAVLAGLVAQRLFGAWWIDAVVSLALVYYLVREGLEAWGSAECCD